MTTLPPSKRSAASSSSRATGAPPATTRHVMAASSCGCTGARRLEDGRAVLAQLGSTDPCALPAASPAQLASRDGDARFEDFAALAQQLSPGSVGLEAELSRRWAALALRGEQDAPAQAGLNAASRRKSAAELMGRAELADEDVLRPQAEACLRVCATPLRV